MSTSSVPTAPRLTLDEAARNIGKPVDYHPHGQPAERGTITGVNLVYVFVLYVGDTGSKATAPGMLSLA